MANGWTNKLRESATTPEHLYFDRRQLMAGGMAALGASLAPTTLRAGPFDAGASPNTFEDITSYNNYYEFGLGKSDPARYASALTTSPWTVTVDGLTEAPGDYDLRELLDKQTVEDRIYRLRCVEAWSMVIPWQGIEFRDILDRLRARDTARFVHFETVLRPEEMRLPRGVIDWPYVESLRMDEARHPLTLLATGLYGRDLPKQNGAPVRLVVPWKYGFKSIKAIRRITFSDSPILTSWMKSAPSEYGYYANVNPRVNHPRWSQATERVIGAGLFGNRRETEMFNGYGEDVAGLYAGMDLRENF